MKNLIFIIPIIALLCVSDLQAKEPAVGHPFVYATSDDIRQARENIARHKWAQETADALKREADIWLSRDDRWILSVVPPKGACFAYGFTGCPICGASWGTWAGVNASFDRPGKVTCASGHAFPDAEHPDSGTGYAGKDGRIHYMVGSYNAWVVETLTFKAADSLAYTYSLTGDARYATKAALILDALAAIYPSCDKGSWDYPSNPPSGRFNRPWYQAARVLVHYVDQYDRIYHDPSLDAPSLAPGLTRRQNIEENLLKNGAAYCFRESQAGALHNGEADYIRGALAVGVCLDIPEYVRWAVDGPYGIYSMLDNNIDRDGFYYETSAFYADHTRELYTTFAEPLLNYRGSAYPNGVNLYAYPRFRRFLQFHNLSQNCLGHRWPPYGDTAPSVRKILPPERPFDGGDYRFLECLYARTEAKEERDRLASALRWLAGGDIEKARQSYGGAVLGEGFINRRWLLFHAQDAPGSLAELPPDTARRLTGCDFLGQKGIAILRTGEEKEAQALLFRFGPSLNHGHLDDLNINYFARGYEMTYDLGYNLGSTHTQVGWAFQTASHNLVVVDETSQGDRLGRSGGSLHLFADLPAVKLVEASSEASYAAQKVSLYRRTAALICDPLTGQPIYLFDLFRVRGGSQHDYLFHALSDRVEFTGLTFGPEEPGSLAGPDIDWGGKQLNDGDMESHPNEPYWNPPPGNGYGFLTGPRRAQPRKGWSADWAISDEDRLRLVMPAMPGMEIVTVQAPGLYPTLPKSRYVIARNKGRDVQSRFMAAIEPYGNECQALSVETLKTGPEAAGARIARKNGLEDILLSAPDGKTRTCGSVTFAGRFARVALKQGELQSLTMVGGTYFTGFGWRVRLKRGAWSGTVLKTDSAGHTILTQLPLPVDGSLNGKTIIFSNLRYSRTTAYRISRIEAQRALRRVYLNADTALGRGQVGEVMDARTLTSSIPHEYAHSVRRIGESGFFEGKLLRTGRGAQALVQGIAYGQPMRLSVDSAQGFEPGDVFHYEDIQAGDRFEIAASLSLVREASGEYRLESETKAEVTGPGGTSVTVGRLR
ncbi:MAG: heparinase II/III family protein [Armatimonadetes bacterium]|nr:heparinase II/III family protein [Armatimonadota bacterium]